MSLPMVLLEMLAEPASGYDLRKRLETDRRHIWTARLSQIYPALKQLENDHMIRSNRQTSALGPDRIVYERTEAGTDALRAWAEHDLVLAEQKNPFLAGILARKALLPESSAQSGLRDLLEQAEARLESQLTLIETCESSALRPTLELAAEQTRTLIRWLEEQLAIRAAASNSKIAEEECDIGIND